MDWAGATDNESGRRWHTKKARGNVRQAADPMAVAHYQQYDLAAEQQHTGNGCTPCDHLLLRTT